MEDVNWERIDKKKFFLQGVSLFSGVTGCLYPLSVIKTRQMASHGVSAGFQGMKDTVRNIWTTEGVPGFYRGFSTVIFGTIPARMVYLASLEIVKDGVSKVGKDLQLSQTTTAGIANFAGGAAASLSIQMVTVPIDVISQRQVVYGTDAYVKQGVASARTASTTGTRHTHVAAHSQGSTHHAASTSAATATTPGTHAPTPQSGSAATPSSQSLPQQQQAQTRAYSSGRDLTTRRLQQSQTWHPVSQVMHSIQSTPRTYTGQAQHTSTQQHRHIHQQRHATHQVHPACTTDVSGQGPSQTGTRHAQIHHRCASTAAAATPAAGGAAPGSTVVRLSGLDAAKMILREEGVLGFYRGFGMSIATFVPSSAVWWSAYGVYQQVVSSAYLQLTQGNATTSRSSDHAIPDAPHAHGASGLESDRSVNVDGDAVACAKSKLSGRETAMIQLSSSMLAGMTASLITNPLDLVKTRIQVAARVDNEKVTVRGVVREIIAQDGPAGLLRGVLPRMVSSAMWGTAMVSAYEFLKRISLKDEPAAVQGYVSAQ